MTYIIIWQYDIVPSARDEFERIYRSDGDWAALFRAGEGYLGTQLLRDRWTWALFVVVLLGSPFAFGGNLPENPAQAGEQGAPVSATAIATGSPPELCLTRFAAPFRGLAILARPGTRLASPLAARRLALPARRGHRR